jgi:two-component system cell cycle sensor histidine kinase/response regulator CckA
MTLRRTTRLVTGALFVALVAGLCVTAHVLADGRAETVDRSPGGGHALVSLAGTALVLALAFGLALVATVERAALSRIAGLTQRVSDIAGARGIAARVPVSGRDEVATLADSINAMLDSLETARNSLAESETRFRAVADQASVLIWLANPEGARTFFNDGWLSFTGRDAASAAGFGWTEDLHPDDRPRCLDAIARASSAREGYQLDYRLKRPDGSYGWVLEQAVPRLAADGQLAGFAGSCVDTTERQQLEVQLQQAQRMEAIGCLAGGVSHDFNNMLTVILGYVDVLREYTEADGPAREAADAIRGAAERASSLTRQLLTFSRRQPVTTKVVDVNEAVTNVGHLVGRIIGADITVVTATEPALGRVRADPSQIEQVLMNLVVNARDAMSGGGRLTIRTRNVELDESSARRYARVKPGRYVLLEIADTGHGMDAATKARIFEPLFTTKEPGKGTGLGLATVYGIVKQSGGHIVVESTPGAGSTFQVYLPRVDEEPAAACATPAWSDAPRGHETILVAEDEDAVRQLLGEVLGHLGYTVIEAHDALEALRYCNTFTGRIDLLLTDLIMPGMNGRTLADNVRAGRPAIATLFMSGYTDHAVQRDLGTAHASFVQKPFSPELIARKVREAIDGPRSATRQTAA